MIHETDLETNLAFDAVTEQKQKEQHTITIYNRYNLV